MKRSESANHPWRPAPRHAVAVASLREVPAPRAARVRRAGYPVGLCQVERQAPAMLALHRVRQRGRDYPASGLGRR
jgi:hypothetical protein